MAEAFPLEWPDGWKRASSRRRARYQVEFGKALHDMKAELRRMKAQSIVVSSNVPVKANGDPYADAGSRRFEDPGVALYFFWNDSPWVVACDTWDLVKDNLRAVGLALEALRMFERTGASDLLRRAYTGFKALPAPGQSCAKVGLTPSEEVDCWKILEVSRDASREVVEAAYRAKAKTLHPDLGGSHDEMSRLNTARSEALRAVIARARQSVRG